MRDEVAGTTILVNMSGRGQGRQPDDGRSRIMTGAVETALRARIDAGGAWFLRHGRVYDWLDTVRAVAAAGADD